MSSKDNCQRTQIIAPHEELGTRILLFTRENITCFHWGKEIEEYIKNFALYWAAVKKKSANIEKELEGTEFELM